MTTDPGGVYGAGRQAQELRWRGEDVDAFITRYYDNQPSRSHKTVFLFPGGLGSKLMRAQQPFTSAPPYSYYMAWLGCNIAFGEATSLQLSGAEDYQGHFIVAEGAVDLVVLNPYGGFKDWCAKNGIDLFIFAWDWRRSIDDTATFFLGTFLPYFENALKTRKEAMPDFTLVGHSFGGMVIKTIANRGTDRYVGMMQKAITVCSPFYGYGGHLHRFFKGDSDLNWTEGPHGATVITKIVSTMPAAYELLFMDEATYDANAAAFRSDPDGYNLLNYPCMDGDDPTQVADPYDPRPTDGNTFPGNMVRFIGNCGFDWAYLATGKEHVVGVAQPLDPRVASKFYCIRGVQRKDGRVLNETVVSQTWKRVKATFNPDVDRSPITDINGPGDGTQPAWTARLLGLPAGHVTTLWGDFEHMTMMNEQAVQRSVGGLLGIEPPDQIVVPQPELTIANRAELDKFLDEARRIAMAEGITQFVRQERIAAFLRTFTEKQKQDYLARAYIDGLKSPSQKRGP